MTILMIHDTPGITEEAMREFERLGLIDKLTAAPGFGGHCSGPTDTGYRVVELWDSRESWLAWFEGNVASNMPPGPPVGEPTFFDLARVIPAPKTPIQG